MKRACVSALLVLTLATPVEAEQPEAAEYRSIFRGDFYVEYEDQNVKKVIMQEKGRRMAKTALTGAQTTLINVLNPLAKVFGTAADYPDYMHSKGKYYKFAESDTAFVLEESRLGEENLNPREGWQTVERALSLPDELAVFNWTEPFHKVSTVLTEPIFVESITKTVDGRQYACDRYESKAVKRKDVSIIFEMMYAEGVLKGARSAISVCGLEYELNKLSIKKITKATESKGFRLNVKAKVYLAGLGDMNDLLETPVLVGSLEETDR